MSNLDRYKFRGQKTTTKEWVYGNFVRSRGRNYITFDSMDVKGEPCYVEIRVDAATVGQWTGLQDKNGVDIYEGDEVTRLYPDGGVHFVKNVRFFEGAFVIGESAAVQAMINFNAPRYLEVTGNIHDKAESCS